MSKRKAKRPLDCIPQTEYEMRFEENLKAFEARLGYSFANQDILRQVFTSGSFNSFGTTYPANKRLEREGDSILSDGVMSWIKGQGLNQNDSSRTLRDFLNSNVYLSAVGIRLGIDMCVRFSKTRAQLQSNESQVRLTANAVEALIAAVERDSGGAATNEFFARHLTPPNLPVTLIGAIFQITMGNLGKILESFEVLVGGRAKIVITHKGSKDVVRIDCNGERTFVSSRLSLTDRVVNTICKFLYNNPWILWGFDGPVSLRLPCSSYIGYGATYSDQSDYMSPHARQFRNNSDEVIPLTNPILCESRKHREEYGWEEVQLPTLTPNSSIRQGSYIDKLRHHVGDKNLEVRTHHLHREIYPRFAFFLDNVYLSTSKDRKNLNDAAGEVIREFFSSS